MAIPLLTNYLQPLLAGRRADCFAIIEQALAEGWAARRLLNEVVWPALSQVERLFIDDRINIALEHMASLINRTVADRLQSALEQQPRNGKRIIVACADGFREEIGAQIVADLFQSEGWEVFFVGGGVPDDELLQLVGQVRPETLLLFGTEPQQVPGVRRLVELIREVDVCPTMNIVVSGGIFNRADGLWQEVGVDAFAATAESVMDLVREMPPRVPGPPRRGTVKKRQRRRTSKQPVTQAADATSEIQKPQRRSQMLAMPRL